MWDFGGFSFTNPTTLKIPLTNNHHKGIYFIGKTSETSDKITRIYIGETHDQTFEERITITHHKYDCWKNTLKEKDYLVVSFYYMDDSPDSKIKEVETNLLSKKSTTCND